MTGPSSFSIEPSSMNNLRHRKVSLPKYIGCTSNHSTMNSQLAPCGVSRTRLPARLRDWIPYLNSKPQPSWERFSHRLPTSELLSTWILLFRNVKSIGEQASQSKGVIRHVSGI